MWKISVTKDKNADTRSAEKVPTMYLIISSAMSMLPLMSQNAISGSIIQNSEACLAVLEFSARNVGPNV